MSRLENPNNPCIDRLKNARELFISRKGSTLLLMARFEVESLGMYQGSVSTLEMPA